MLWSMRTPLGPNCSKPRARPGRALPTCFVKWPRTTWTLFHCRRTKPKHVSVWKSPEAEAAASVAGRRRSPGRGASRPSLPHPPVAKTFGGLPSRLGPQGPQRCLTVLAGSSQNKDANSGTGSCV